MQECAEQQIAELKVPASAARGGGGGGRRAASAIDYSLSTVVSWQPWQP